ncbi:MAG: hypothetical protein MJ210_00560 [Alphaproteobacteria bacterium]|nr:hypothetical protein [Alphaproteobacteria bacterium]
MIKKIISLICLLYAGPLWAGNITIDATERVEYHQKEQKIVVKGNAVVTKDSLHIKAETLVGYYAPKSKNKFSKIEGFKDIKIKTPNGVLTAGGEFVYYDKEEKAVAKNNVVITDIKGNTVKADLMTAYLAKDKQGNFLIKNIEIEKNIRITNQDTIVTADNGSYNAAKGHIVLSNNVVIRQKGNILKGSKAETNLNSGISRILSGKNSNRVSGVFEEKKKKD